MSSILDHPLIGERYFFPRQDSPPNPVMVDCKQAKLACVRHRPHPGAKTLVHFHGNGEVTADYLGPFLDSVAAIGLNIFLAEYRGYGGSSGTPMLAGMLEDVPYIIDAVGEPVDQLIFFGRSLGSFYAIHGAHLYPSCAGLVIESGIADVKERLLLRVHPEELGCTDETFDNEIHKYLDHHAKLDAFQGPVLVMHTRHDGLVDMTHAQRNYNSASGPKFLKIFEQGDHNSIIPVNAAAYFTAIQLFANTIEEREKPNL